MEPGKIIYFSNHKYKKQMIVLKKIGQGAFGEVYKVFVENSGLYAVKVQRPFNRKMKQNIINEFRISEILSNEFTVNLFVCVFNPKDSATSDAIYNSKQIPEKTVLLFYPLFEGKNLLNYMIYLKSEKMFLPRENLLTIVESLIKCLEYMFSKNVCHTDLKPENIMISKKLNVKFIDFGMACFCTECPPERKSGTPVYLPPEFYNGRNPMNWHKADIFAIGMTIFNLVSGKKSMYGIYKLQTVEEIVNFCSRNTNEQLTAAFVNVLNKIEKENPILSKFYKLIIGMIFPDPEKRYNINQIKKIYYKTMREILD